MLTAETITDVANDAAPEITAEQITFALNDLLAKRDAICAVARSIGADASYEPIVYLPYTQQTEFVVCAWATLTPGLSVDRSEYGITVWSSSGAVVGVRAPVREPKELPL